MSKRGRFLVVEGLEGAGKTTAIETIANVLKSSVQNLILVREPGSTSLGESIRDLVKAFAAEQAIAHRSELLLMYAARVQLLEEVIFPALKRGDWVLSDRFELSSYAYQGGGRGIALHDIDALSHICLHDFEPDWTFFLDIPPEIGLERVRSRGVLDRIEKEPLDFFIRVRQCYMSLLEKKQHVSIIDATKPLPAVQQAIIKQLTDWMVRYELV